MVFQDGGGFIGEKGTYRAPVVFDNLIHRKELPVIDRHFHQSGNRAVRQPARAAVRNRSFEYDTPSDQYVRFLEKEILPEVKKNYNLRTDAAGSGNLRR